MEPIAAFPGLTSVATSEMLSQLTIDQSLEKGGTILLPLAVNSHAFNNWVKQQGWIDDTGDWMDNVLSFLWEGGLEGIEKTFICSLTSSTSTIQSTYKRHCSSWTNQPFKVVGGWKVGSAPMTAWRRPSATTFPTSQPCWVSYQFLSC